MPLIFIYINEQTTLNIMDSKVRTIKINGKEYKVKYTIRALFMFEQICNKAFSIKTLLDNYVFFYCIILANNQDNILDWNEYIEALDNDATLYESLNQLVNDSVKINALTSNDEEKGDKKKVKKA